jgi:Uracil DNA glycosylase superfamily
VEKLPDQLQSHLRLVFVGTAASRRSTDLGHYYAGPGNRFWRTLHEVGITPRRYEPHEFPTLLSLGIGFTDVCKLGSGMDHQALTFPRRHSGLPGKDAALSAEDHRLHQQEGGEPFLWTTDESDRAGPAAVAAGFSRCLRAGLAIRRRIGLLVGAAMAGIGGFDRPMAIAIFFKARPVRPR